VFIGDRPQENKEIGVPVGVHAEHTVELNTEMSQKPRFLQDSLARIREALPEGKHNSPPERRLKHQPSWFESGVPVRIWETVVKDRLEETATYTHKLFL